MPTHCKPIADRWEEVKPIFLQLYRDDDKSLVEVRRELEHNHQFTASRAAFTRQIVKWNAFKNYKAVDKQQLAAQRIQGQQPKVDRHGRPIKWERVYRGTRVQKTPRRRPGSRVNGPGLASYQKVLVFSTRRLLQPIDHDVPIVGCVVNIWRHSTVQFASRDPLAPEYHGDHSLYNGLMESMAIINRSSISHWPQRQIDTVCDSIPVLIKNHPAMACDLLNFLMSAGPAKSSSGSETLRDQLFKFIRDMSRQVLPENNSFRQLTSHINNRKSLTRLGAAIAKTKLDTMWNTRVADAEKAQHERPFFRQVLLKAIHVVMDYEEFELAARYLKKLSAYDPKDSFYLAACARLYEQGETGRDYGQEQ